MGAVRADCRMCNSSNLIRQALLVSETGPGLFASLIRPNNLSRYSARLRRPLGLPHIRFHDL